MKKISKIVILFVILVLLLFIIFAGIWFQNRVNRNTRKTEGFENLETGNRYACFYAYYEKNEMYKINFEYFLKNGLLENVDYYIIINGNSTVKIPEKRNVKIFTRENKGYDFGAYSYAIQKINKKYEYYFFLNTSVKGPYLRDNSKPWINYFLELFTTKDIKLVGTSVNIYPLSSFEKYNLDEIYGNKPHHAHIQCMFFCMDNEYYEYLKKKDFFNEEEMNHASELNYVISYKEFGLSQLALTNHWNINCILPKYRDIDYRTMKNDINPTSNNGDPYYEGAYFGETIDKYDVIFFKNNRF